MKRPFLLSLLFVTLLSLCACQYKETTLSWQEQYDLGIRYLSEGNYEEAIIAFAAAIEIDPKAPEAYIGRGDALYKNGDFHLAERDYLSAIEIEQTIPEIYIKLAEIYVETGDSDKAVSILEQGYDLTEDLEIRKQLEQLMSSDNRYYIKDARATLIVNVRTYKEDVQNHMDTYGSQQGFTMYGIRFDPTVTIRRGLEDIEVLEAGLSSYNSGLNLDNRDDPEEQERSGEYYNWEYFDTTVMVSGYLSCDEDYQTIKQNDDGFILLDPNGPYDFKIEAWRFENDALNIS